MAYKDKEKQHATQKRWRDKNKGKIVKSSKKHYAKNKEKVLAKGKLYRINHPERIKELAKAKYIRDRDKGYYKSDSYRNNYFKRNYGITVEDYNSILIEQDYKCKICRKKEYIEGKCLAVDHNHKTNKVRGLLCTKCNTAIGLFGEQVSILRKAIKHLEQG